jgi:two-component system NtrC family sensor kinase
MATTPPPPYLAVLFTNRRASGNDDAYDTTAGRMVELAQTIDELRETQAKLIQAERLAAVGELAAGVAHEVNNPLNFARNSLRTLNLMVDELSSYACAIGELKLDDVDRVADQLEDLFANFRETDISELADDVKQLVDILGSGLDRTAALVNDLRDFASPRPNKKGPFDFAEAVLSTLQLTESTLNDAQIDLRLNVDQNIPLALGDRSSMSQVILNVIKNSTDALSDREHGILDVSINRSSNVGMLRLVISDDGPGIKSEIVDQIFEPFFTTKEAGKGTGLGLAMCRRTIQEYDGEIWIDSDGETGTHVFIEIPSYADERDVDPQ